MNKYLVKLAKVDLKKYWSHVTGAASKDAAKRVEVMEDVIKNKTSLNTLKRRQRYTDNETTKARKATAAVGGTAIAGAAAGYGYKKHKQNQETRDQISQFYKRAGAAGDAAKTLGGAGVSGVGRILKRIGHQVGETLNTAGGGKIKDYAARSGMKPGSKEYKTFGKSKYDDRVTQMMNHRTKTDKSIGRHNKQEQTNKVKSEVKNLENQQTHARIAVGATGVAGLSAYGHYKARQALKEKDNYYNR